MESTESKGEPGMKTIILYASTHHGNTKKIVQAMAKCLAADVVDITKNIQPDISAYDVVGLASGVYFHSLHESIRKFIDNASFDGKQKAFLVDTCGVGYRDYAKDAKKALKAKGVSCLGSFQCRGYDTFGVFGKIGGIAKKHPNEKDLENARIFAQNLM